MNTNGPGPSPAEWMDHRDELLDRVVRRGRARKRRRRGLGGAAAVLAAALAIGVGLSSPASHTKNLHVAGSGPDHETPTTLHPARPAGVLLIGDQVMLGARQALEHQIPGARVDAGISRQFNDVISFLRADERESPLPQTIVVHLGTNGPPAAQAFDQVGSTFDRFMEAVGPESTVYFVTVKVPRPWEQEVNAALYSTAPRWPNAHVLDWHGFSQTLPWFTSDGFHLDPVGQTAYAAFIADAIHAHVTRADPFSGAAIPTSGLVVTDDVKTGKAQGPSSFSLALYNDAGMEQGELPRATISDDVLNAARVELVATDSGIQLAPRSLDAAGDTPAGCTPTEKNPVLAVALCGPGTGDQILGNRILVNRGAGWSQLIAKPPVRAGDPLVGHWAWASPSPDGRWVLAGWSAECEVQFSMFVSVADGSVHTVTGQAGVAWRNAPESGSYGWTADGNALAAFGGDSACGTAAPDQRGLYVVSPDAGVRRLLIPLTPSQGLKRWTAVDDRRTRPQAAGSPLRVDLDGDGRADRLTVTPEAIGADAPSRMAATLADGRVVSGTVPAGYGVRILGAADIAGDGRHEVFVQTGGNTLEDGVIVVLDGDRLGVASVDPNGFPFVIDWGGHSNGNPGGTIDVACRDVDGHPSLVTTNSSVTLLGGANPQPEKLFDTPDSQLERHWQRDVYALDGARLVLRKRDSGVLPMTSRPPADLPLANAFDCGGAGM